MALFKAYCAIVVVYVGYIFLKGIKKPPVFVRRQALWHNIVYVAVFIPPCVRLYSGANSIFLANGLLLRLRNRMSV